MHVAVALLVTCLLACGSTRTQYARPPGAALTFDRAAAPKEALDVADKVLAAHGGAPAWEAAKQIRWKQAKLHDRQPPVTGEQAWDRWNARHFAKVEREKAGAFGVMYELYGTYAAGYIEGRSGQKQVVPTGEAAEGVVVARKGWQRDTVALFAAFLLHEPGATLAYGGIVRDNELELHDLTLTFDPKDPARAGIVVHVYANAATSLIRRVELELGGERYGYVIDAYQAAGGLQVPAKFTNLGSGDVYEISNVQVGNPDDDLFIAPVS
jgi:hypothetical protein